MDPGRTTQHGLFDIADVFAIIPVQIHRRTAAAQRISATLLVGSSLTVLELPVLERTQLQRLEQKRAGGDGGIRTLDTAFDRMLP